MEKMKWSIFFFCLFFISIALVVMLDIPSLSFLSLGSMIGFFMALENEYWNKPK